MERTFKHKETDAIAQRTSWGNYSLDGKGVEDLTLPAPFVENSNDWIELTEPILTTADGFDLHYGDTYWVLRDDSSLWQMELSSNTIQSSKVMRFCYKENAEAYIYRHKAKYSDSDMDWLVQQVEKLKAKSSDIAEMRADVQCLIHALRTSKND